MTLSKYSPTSLRAIYAIRVIALIALLASNLVPLAAPANISAADLGDTPRPSAAPAPAATNTAATKTDALLVDNDGDGRADPGDTLRYTVAVSNTGTTDATGLVISDTLDPNTRLVAGSVRVSPLAFTDSYNALRNTPLTITAPGLLANDTGTPAPTITPASKPTSAGGTVTLNANGSFSYTPPSGYTDTDSFSYTVSNSAGSDSATVTLLVQSAPVAVNDSYNASRNTPLTIAAPGLLANDTGFPTPTLTPASAVPTTAGGTVTLNADGSFSYTPLAGYLGADSFSYTITNPAGSATATVSLTVGIGPAAVDDPSYVTLINTVLNVPAGAGDLLSNDSLGTPAATLTSFGGGALGGTVTSNTAGSTATFGTGGSLVVNADGSFTFTPATGFTGSFTFLYRITNTFGTSDATATIAVRQGPTAVDDPSYLATTGQALNVPTGASDLLSNDALGFPAATLVSFGAGSLGGAVTTNATGSTATFGTGSLTVNADGSFAFTSDTGFTGNFTFQYRLSNVIGTSDATVTIFVRQGPTAVDDPSYVTLINTVLNVPAGAGDLLSNDSLGTPAATLTSFGGGALGGTVTSNTAGSTATFGTGGSLVINADGSFTFTPATGFTGSFTFLYRITNTIGTADATVTIAVRQGPTAVDDPSYLATTGQALNVPTGASDLLSNDALGFPAATLVSFGAGSLGGAVTTNATGSTATFGTGSLTVNADGSFAFTSDTGFTGNFTFQYRLSNVIGTSDATVTIFVRQGPTAADDSYNMLVNGTLNQAAAGGLLTNDTLGVPAATIASFGGGALGGVVTTNTAGASVALAGGTLTVNTDGSFTLTTPTTTGNYTFLYRIANVVGTSDATVMIAVRQGPTAVDDPSYVATTGQALNVPAGASDLLSNDTLGFPDATLTSFGGGSLGGAVTDNAAGSTVTLGTGALTVNADGSFDFTSNTGFTGNFTFQYRLTNVVGTSDATVTIFVRQGPTAADDSYNMLVNGTLNQAAAGGLLTNDTLGVPAATITSFGGGALGGVVTTNAAGASVALAGGTLTVNADGSFTLATPTTPGNYTFLYRIANVVGTSDATVTIAVRQAPTAVDDGVYTVNTGSTLTILTSAANDLLDNDTLGTPAATLTSFGGGSLGGVVTANAAGASVALAGGTLTVNADGSFTFATPTTPGNYTFLYRIQNVVGFSDATVSIQVRQPPTAVDDGVYGVNTGATLTILTSAPNDLLDNDTLGFPAATLTSFGGGALGGAVTTNAAGASVALAGGTLTVNADGSFTFATPTTPGNYTFLYRLSNAGGFSDATVSIQVRQPPTAVDDGVYGVNTGATLTILTSAPNDLLDNDTLGFPAATLTSFGGGALGGVVTTNAAGASVALAGGTLTVNADGSFTLATPTTPGNYTLLYRLSNAGGFSDATVSILVRQPPTAVDDGVYAVNVGGTLNITTAAPNDLLDNDTLGFPAATITSFGGGALGGAVTTNAAGTSVALAGGTLTVNADGSFTLATPTTPGNYTFLYRLSNAGGFSDATVSIQVRQPPTAVDDGVYTVNAGSTLTILTSAPNDLLDNDTLGFPAATLTSFGGGALGGAVTTNAAGASVALAGGTLTVNADGSFTFATPTTGGNYTFLYRLSNAGGFSDATVSIQVRQAPTAVDDTVAVGSSPADTYHTALNTPLSIPDGPNDLLANDTLGTPAATLVNFGAIELAQVGGTFAAPIGTVTTNAAGATATFSTGGSLTVNADGTLSFTPPTNYTGLFRFRYRIQNVVGFSDGTVTLAVGERLTVVNETYPTNVVGNVRIDTSVSSNFSVLSNETGDGLSIALGTPNNGNVTLNANGTFIFNPTPGYTGVGGFTYTVSNGFGSATGTLSLTVSGMIWFVDNNAGTNGDGRLGTPFNSLTNFVAGAADDPGDNIFLYRQVATSYTGGITLQNNQQLIGQGATGVSLSALVGLTPPADSPTLPTINGTRPVLDTATTVITLGSGNTIRGLDVGDSTTNDISGTSFGTLTVRDVTLTDTGRALNLDTGTLDAVFASVTSTNGINNISLTTVGGSLTISGGALSGASGDAFFVDGGAASVSYAGTINNTTTKVVRIQNKTAGTVDLAGAVTSTGTGMTVSGNSGSTINLTGATKTLTTGANPAVTLSSNGGSTINFSGGGLDIDTTSGAGFTATGGGTVNVTTGANPNTINSTTGTAVNIANTTISASGVTFRSVAANGATNGIVLNTTGSSGSFTVTGDGGGTNNGSGGTIQNSTGPAVLLTSASAVSLGYLNIQNSGADGILGTTVTGFTLNRSVLTNNGNAVGEDGINFNGLFGNASITNSTVTGSQAHNVLISNANGTLNSLTITNSTFSNNNVTNGLDGVSVTLPPGSSGVINTITVTGSSFSNNKSDGMQVNAEGTGSVGAFTFTGNTMTGNDVGVNVSSNGSGDINFDISNNPTLTGVRTQINVANNGGAASNMQGRITNNPNIGSSDDFSIALWVVDESNGTITLMIDGNTVNDFGDTGIDVESRGPVGGNVQATIRNNVVSQPGTPSPVSGMLLRSGAAGNASLLCVNVSSNNINAGPFTVDSPLADYYLRRLNAASSVFQIQGLSPAPATNTQARDYIISTDSAPPATGFASTGTYTAATCATPTLPQFAAGGEGHGVPGAQVTQPQLDAVATAAINRWAAAGLPAAQLAQLRAASVQVADLEAGHLGDTFGATVEIDRDAAGWGWFVDATPGDDSEFSTPIAATERHAAQGSPADGRMDLLTVVMHEFGHILGRDDIATAAQPHDLMTDQLPTGARRSLRVIVSVASAPAVAPASVTTTPSSVQANIGTLPAGKHVVIIFDVLIAAPIPQGVNSVSNQASISGGNFATLLTDDPATAAAVDPTVTALDVVKKVYLPLMLHSVAQVPDLVVSSVTLNPNKTAFTAGEPVQISVVIKNQGNGAAAPFWVDLYLNPSSTPTLNQLWNKICGINPCYGVAWQINQSLAPGAELTLTSTVGSYAADYTRWPGGFAAGTTDLYVLADSWNPGKIVGASGDTNLANNLFHISGLQVTGQNVAGAGMDVAIPARP